MSKEGMPTAAMSLQLARNIEQLIIPSTGELATKRSFIKLIARSQYLT